MQPSTTDRSQGTAADEVVAEIPQETRIHSSSNIVDQPIEIHARRDILSVAFLADGKHVVSGGREGKIRRWRVEDGQEIGIPMETKGHVFNLAASQDGRIVSGTSSGQVAVWDAMSHVKVEEFCTAHDKAVNAVDISSDGTKVASGSDDKTASVWSLSTGERICLAHSDWVVAVKFSPSNGHYIATATWDRQSVRVYDRDHLLAEFSLHVNSQFNRSLAWACDNERLFVLSRDACVYCLNVPTGAMISKWTIHDKSNPRCIALSCNDTIVATSTDSSVSFWDTTTQQRIGCVIDYAQPVRSMAISAYCDVIATCGYKFIHIRCLLDILPHPYRELILREREIRLLRNDNLDLHNTIKSFRAEYSHQCARLAILEETVRGLRDQLAVCKCDASCEDKYPYLDLQSNMK